MIQMVNDIDIWDNDVEKVVFDFCEFGMIFFNENYLNLGFVDSYDKKFD